MLIDFNFAKIRKHPDRPPLTAFACSTVSQLRVKTDLVRMGHKWAALNKKWSHDLRMLLQIFHLHFRWDFAYMQLFSCLYKNKCTDICNNKEQAPFPRFCHLIWVVHWLYSLLVALNTRADLGLSCGSHNLSHLTVLLWLSSLDLTYGFFVAPITRVILQFYCGFHH